jgi:MarR-like DNA-binding transcriptional regulator SgrR of sgrS sRNA
MNTYTYRHSELPPVRPEIKAEIVALDVQIADLILKSQGNYRELQELAEVLDSCLDTCELNLQSIRITADDTQQQPPVTMQDLPLKEKELIYSISFTNSVLLNYLSLITKKKPEDIGADLAVLSSVHKQQPLTLAEINNLITQLTLCQSEITDSGFVFKRMSKPA